MGLLQLLAILWARRLVIIGCFAATVALAVGITLVLPKSYEAKVVVLVDHDARDAYTNDFQSRSGVSEFLGKQVAIIKSNRTALEVVNRLKLAENPRFRRDFFKATGGKKSIEEWISQRLLKNLFIWPNLAESSIQITFRSPDSDIAATVANAFADAYMRTNVEIRVKNAQQTAANLKEQARSLQRELSAAELDLRKFQEKTGLVVAEGSLDSEMKKLDALTELSVETSARTEAASAQLSAFKEALAAGRSVDELEGVADNELLQSLRSDIASLNADLAQIRGRYGNSHPDYTSGLARRRALENEIRSEVDRLVRSLEAAVQGGQKKQSDLMASIEAQKKTVVKLREHWDELQIFMNEVKTKRAELEQTLARSGEESIESRVSSVSALVLSPADPPNDPNFPNLLLNTVLAIGFGGIFGLLMAVLVELYDRRVRTTADLTAAAGAPVIVVVPKMG